MPKQKLAEKIGLHQEPTGEVHEYRQPGIENNLPQE